ncbi:MAG TPA: hypothetical protein VLJ58_09440 [Ramlibacter sp.]|nr:hypothetical protein [Ramlibacter sp.]
MVPAVTAPHDLGRPAGVPAPDPPSAGQYLLDAQGVRWKVLEVISSPFMKGFYIVRLAKGPGPHGEQDLLVLGRGEYTALCKEHQLRTDAGQ